MSFKAKAVSGSQTAYIQNCKTDTNRTKIEGLTEEWKDFQYTLTVDSTGYLGFFIDSGNGIEIKELQIEQKRYAQLHEGDTVPLFVSKGLFNIFVIKYNHISKYTNESSYRNQFKKQH